MTQIAELGERETGLDLLPELSERRDEAGARSPSVSPSRLDGLGDVPVRLSAVLGKKRMSVADLMALEPGAVIELDRKVGDPIDLYVNDRLIARGELVLVEGSLGVTMTEIVRRGDI